MVPDSPGGRRGNSRAHTPPFSTRPAAALYRRERMTVLLRLIVSVALVSGACRGAPRSTVSLHGSEVRRVEVPPSGAVTGREPALGDWILRDHALRITVAGEGAAARGLRPGAITQALRLDAPGRETVRTVEPLISVTGRLAPEIAHGFEAVVHRGAPALRIRSRVRRAGVSLDVERTLWIESGRGALRVRTEIANASTARATGIQWGARLGYGGEAPFAPGLGVLSKDHEGRAPWLGFARDGVASAWTVTPLDALSIRYREETHGATVMSAESDAFGPLHALEPGARVADEALLVLRRGEMADVAQAAADARGDRVVGQWVRVFGAERAPVTVHVADNADRLMMRTDTRDGRVRVPLPPGRFRAWVSAAGHAVGDAEPFEITPEKSGEVPVELVLPPGGSLRVTARDADTGRELPVRITVRGVAPTGDPNLGPNHRGAGAGPVVVAATGRAGFPVPPGKYTVTVSHGPEWTIAQQDVTVTETLRGDVDVRLSRAVPMPGWIACDLHVHANPSFDSAVTVEDRVASLVAEGVGFATPTEHNVVGDYGPGVAVLPPNVTEGLQWVPAVEVTTDQNVLPFGHFNVYPYRPDRALPGGGPPPFVSTTPTEIFRAARAREPDTIIQVNHPRMQPNIGYFETMGLDPRTGHATNPLYDPGFDAIEVFNGFFIGDIAAVEGVLQDYMGLLGTGARYVATGSSDSHAVAFQWAGYPRTYVHVGEGFDSGGEVDPAVILRALRRGRAFASSGPMLLLTVDGAEPGETVPAREGQTVRARVQVLAAPWIPVSRVTLWRDGQRAAEFAVPPSRALRRLDVSVDLEVSPGSFVLATARGPDRALEVVLPWSRGTPYAFTNPVFFEAPEDAGR